MKHKLTGKLSYPMKPPETELEAIARHCAFCLYAGEYAARACKKRSCPLWPYRSGTDPAVKTELSKAQKASIEANRQKALAASRRKREARESASSNCVSNRESSDTSSDVAEGV